MKRPVGRPSTQRSRRRPTTASEYQAKSWDRAPRVVAQVEWHAGELFSQVGFVVTDLRRSPKRVIKFYVRGDPGADQSAASGAEPRVIIRRGWMRVASSRGGWGWSAAR
ncbi:MAG: transposase [Planctomycetaceae bacterium]|nr:transposase [Planctomycetaceae bacterium]